MGTAKDLDCRKEAKISGEKEDVHICIQFIIIVSTVSMMDVLELKCKRKAREANYWPGINMDIKKMIVKYDTYLRHHYKQKS